VDYRRKITGIAFLNPVVGCGKGEIKTITKHVDAFRHPSRTRVRFPPPPFKYNFNDLEDNMKITPLDIRKQEFKKSFKGYDKNEVDIFLEMTAKEVENLIRENKSMQEQLRDLDLKVEDYKRMEKTLQDTLTSAQKTTDEIRRNARKEAEMIIKKAKIEASEILEDVQSQLRDLKNQISALKNQRDGFIAQLRGFLSSQLKMLDEIERIKAFEEKKKKVKEEEESSKSSKKVGELFNE
jgi:cell division initiation protein